MDAIIYIIIAVVIFLVIIGIFLAVLWMSNNNPNQDTTPENQHVFNESFDTQVIDESSKYKTRRGHLQGHAKLDSSVFPMPPHGIYGEIYYLMNERGDDRLLVKFHADEPHMMPAMDYWHIHTSDREYDKYCYSVCWVRPEPDGTLRSINDPNVTFELIYNNYYRRI